MDFVLRIHNLLNELCRFLSTITLRSVNTKQGRIKSKYVSHVIDMLILVRHQQTCISLRQFGSIAYDISYSKAHHIS